MNRLIFRIILLLTSFSFSLSLSAQEEAVDPKAKRLLDKATAAFNSKKGIEAEFTIKVENARDGRKDSNKGVLWLKNERFKLTLLDVETYFDGKTQAVYMLKEKEVTLSAPEADDLKEVNPLLLMKSYQTDYKMRYLGVEKLGQKTVERVELYPNDLNSRYSIITLLIESETMRLQSIRLRGKDGIHTSFDVTQMRVKELGDAEFVFDEKRYPNVEVVDLR